MGTVPARPDGEDSKPSVVRQRDQAGDERDQAGDERDRTAEQRDQAGDERDRTAEQRDQVGDERDRTAEQRDRAAEQSEASDSAATTAEALNRSALARRKAAGDRRDALQDRREGARERRQAELDRNIALADRAASAREREDASVDGLTGTYLWNAGLAQLEREIATARREQQPLVLAFVEVDGLRIIRDSRGPAAGDRMLVEVANALREGLRSYDLIIRYGDDQFICALLGLNMAGAAKRLTLVKAELADAHGHRSLTLGLAELQPDDSPQALVARADAALYRQRQQSSDHVPTQVWECGDLVVDEGTQSVT
ncbi:MAG: diguanylate cyclase, partial [Actinobacteria bacterium]|nr:diguanylate cyclase [Actinomycetota bacterium]